MTEPKVQTSTREFLVKSQKILKSLEKHEEGATPKMIALDTSINVNTIKGILPKLENVRKVTRGWYKIYNKGDRGSSKLTSWNFHNCILTTQINTKIPHFINKKYTSDLVEIDLIISQTGKATLRLAAENPLNVSSISLLSLFFQNILKEYSEKIPTDQNIFVSTIEFNKDYVNLRLDGVKCISIKGLTEQFKLYQKSIGLRKEHKTRIKFSVENMVDMLSQNPVSIDLQHKITQQKEQLDRLSRLTAQSNQLLSTLLPKLKQEGLK